MGGFILAERVEGAEPPEFFPKGVGFRERSGPLVEEEGTHEFRRLLAKRVRSGPADSFVPLVDVLVHERNDAICHLVQAGVYLGPLHGLVGKALPGVRVGGQAGEDFCEGVRVGMGEEEAAHIVFDDFRNASYYSANKGASAQHCLHS